MTNTSARQPTHRAYVVTKTNDKSYWREIGAVWPHADEDGFTLKLDFLPLNGGEIVIRKPRKVEAETGEGGEQ